MGSRESAFLGSAGRNLVENEDASFRMAEKYHDSPSPEALGSGRAGVGPAQAGEVTKEGELLLGCFVP